MDFLQMDSNRGFSTEGEKEEVLRWFPETPEKSIQMRQMSQVNWLESLGFPPGLHQQIPSENGASACINSMDLAGSRRGLGPFKEFQTHDRMNTTTGVSNNISFLNLLALSSGTSSADVNLQGTHNAATNFFFPVDSGSNFCMNEHQSLSPVEFWNNKSEYLNAITDGGLPPVDHRIYDLNSPPKTIADCLWDGAQSTESLPVTPDKSQLSNRTYSTSDEGSCREQEQELSTNPNMDEVVEINTGGSTQPMRHMHDLTQLQPENSHPLVDKSAAVLSNHDIDLNEAPQQKPRRKKHRPKVVIQGKPKRTRKQTNDKQNTAVKRKYVRKKGVANSETPSAQIVGEVPSQNSTMKSRKRVLDFNLEDQRREENQQTSLNDHEGFLYNSGKSSSAKQLVSLNSKLHSEGLCNAIGYGPGTKSTLQLGQGIEVTVSNTSAGFAYDLNCSLNQMINDYISLPETTGSAPQSTQRDPPVKNSYCIPTNKNDIKKPTSSLNNCGRITVVPSGKEMQSLSQCGLQSMSIDQFYPDCNLCIPFVGNEQARGSKRKYSRTIDKTDKNTMNLRGGTQHNSLQAYQELPQGFPEICKKRRTAKAQHISTTAANRVRWGQSLQSYHGTVNSQSKNMLGTNMLKYTIKKSVQDVFARPMNTKNCLAQDNTTDPLSFNRATFAELQASGFFINFCLTRRMTKKRSKGSKRARDWASLTAIPQCTQLPSRSLKTVPTRGERPGTDTTQRPLIRLEALVPENHAKKKRTRKVYPPINSMYPDDNQLHVRAKGSMDDQHQSLATTRGRSRVKRPNFATIDEIVHRLKHLDINRETRQTHDLGKNGSMVLYNGNGTMVPYNDNGTMVPYNDNGTMVPYERKRRPRPKVDLDPETEKVWKLLMGKPSSEPMEQTNEEKEKWWEEERRVFQGRADSFIARMHLVQGDRRFSKWKGSVVDSVVGVFLTQNVSDHLSSSAFMSLAARFPLQSKCNKQACCGEGIVAPLEELGVCTPDTEDTITWHENMPNQGVHHQDSMTLHEAAHFEGQEVANSNESFGSNLGYGSYTDITRHNESLPVCDSPGLSPGLLANITDNLKKNVGMVDFIREDRKTLEDAVSSQNSTASSTFQITERNGSCSSDSTSEAEDPVTQSPSKSSSDGLGGTFMELIQMGKNVMLQEEIYNYGSVSSTFNQSPHSEQNQSKGLDSDKHRSSTVNVDCLQDSFAYAYPPSSHLPHKQEHSIHSSTYSLRITPNSGVLEVPCPRMLGEETSSPLPSSASEIKHANSNCKQDALLQECASVLGKPSAGSESPNKHHTLRLDNLQLETCRERNPKSFNQQQKRVEALQSENTANKEPINLDHKLAGHQNSGMHQVPSSMNFSEVLADQENHKDDKTIQSDLEEQVYVADGSATGSTKNLKAKEAAKKKEFDWDSLRKHAYANGGKKERNSNTMDSVDWEAVRCADVNEIASAIKERGMNNMLAERIKAFLNRLVREHESIDLEWLRDAPPDQVKEYLLSVRGLGLKSVECVRLLTLHQLAFPVDTNVGRIAVRLGWVPLQPLPESLQLHLLEMYPVQETIQKYLWPRLCKLDQRTLYELHYQMITFGKVFCTKSKPNCNACPMRGECKHFASAFASARFALPAPEEKSMVSSTAPVVGEHNPTVSIYNQIGSTNTMLLRLPEAAKAHPLIEAPENEENRFEHIVDVPPMPLPLPEATEGCTLIEAPENKEKRCEPIVEVPATPERECTEISENDIEDSFYDDPDEIPTIKLNIEEFTVNLENVLNGYGMELQEGGMSQALVAMNPEAASIPVPKLKNVSRLRTEHQVYELPNSHPLLEGVDEREEDDPSTYLLAIWTPGETPESVQPRESSCGAQESGKLCNEETCFSCNNIRESTSQTVRGTLLIPCRTAMRGSFPLNGTYFQVNEVFADHDSSIKPIDVPRAWLWNLPRRTVYFGTSTSSIFRGLTTEEVQQCFWRGCICVRGFDQKNRAPRPLMARFHFPASRLTKTKINGIQNQN